MSTRPPTDRRPQYFTGQALTAGLLNHNLATEWERRWTHNRTLHGTGIITGLTVNAEIGTATLTVEPGHAIDPQGREIIATTEVTLQVPPKAATAESPALYVLVARWQETPTELITGGTCGTRGVSGWLDEPVFAFIPEDDYPAHTTQVVPLATISVAGCVLFDISFARRRVLSTRTLPYVNAGVYQPTIDEWTVVRTPASPTPVRFGFEVEVDTTVGGFGATPAYQARLSGRRNLAVEFHGEPQPCLLFTPEAQVVEASASAAIVQVLVPTVQVRRLDPEAGYVFTYVTLEEFLQQAGLSDTEAAAMITDDLSWAITWLGVEGQL